MMIDIQISFSNMDSNFENAIITEYNRYGDGLEYETAFHTLDSFKKALKLLFDEFYEEKENETL